MFARFEDGAARLDEVRLIQSQLRDNTDHGGGGFRVVAVAAGNVFTIADKVETAEKADLIIGAAVKAWSEAEESGKAADMRDAALLPEGTPYATEGGSGD